jgi:hypothetical protein
MAAVECASIAEKAPRSNSTRTMGFAATNKATAAGRVKSSAVSSERFSLSIAAA